MCGRNSRAQYEIRAYIEKPLIIEGCTRAKDSDCWRHWTANQWYANNDLFLDISILMNGVATVNEMGSEESFQNISVLQEINQ